MPEQLNLAAEAVDLLVDLGAGGAGAKMATTTDNFHMCSPCTLRYISVSRRIVI